MNGQKLIGLAGFLALGLSPSFVDWQQEKGTGQRWQIIAFYTAALALLYIGVLKRD